MGEPAVAEKRAEGRAFILCNDVFKIYKRANIEVVALRGMDLAVQRGEVVALVGPSGSGKTSLLNILAGLDKPSAGQVSVNGRDLLSVTEADLVRYRREDVGFVWQDVGRNLLPYLSAVENVALPMAIQGTPPVERLERARGLLEAMGLGPKTGRRPAELSGGEQQRVAIAVALANRPPLLLADEPTGELDERTAIDIFGLYSELRRSFGVTVVIVTHYPRIAEYVDRVVAMRDGRASTETMRVLTFRPAEQAGREEEFVVVDRAGRLQLPAEYVEKLGLGGRAKLRLKGDSIEVRRWEPRQDGERP
ncbi:MAG: ABC transporter ATP-binding protein [Dehalococcoidia bacterium]|nr:ABC transporter ATP-binding protein [Dehalococcoidia bacterium]